MRLHRFPTGSFACRSRPAIAGDLQTSGTGTRASYGFAGGTLQLGDTTFTAAWQPAADPPTLTLDQGEEHLVFHAATLTRRDTITIDGRAIVDPLELDPLVEPRVAMVSLLRGNGLEIGYIQIPGDVEPGLDVPADLADGSHDFTMSRTDGALGVERISYGGTGSISVCALVVYENKDGAPGLGRWAFDGCASGSEDCIRGISSVFLVYRDGQTPELAASPYGHLQPGWTAAALLADQTTGMPTLGTLDDSVPVQYLVHIPDDPATVQNPFLSF
jgi:hypothetical protein